VSTPLKISMPALSAGMEEGKIARWLKREGDLVSAGDILAEIETDKATMEMLAECAGVVQSILVAEGESVAVDSPIAILIALEEHSDREQGDRERGDREGAETPPTAAEVSVPIVAEADVSSSIASEPPNPSSRPKLEAPGTHQRRLKASPLARREARKFGVELEQLTGSGAEGRIVRIDVERARDSSRPTNAPVSHPVNASAGVAPSPARPGVGSGIAILPHSTMRKAIARRLTLAKTTIPHFYLTTDCEIDELLAMRQEMNAGRGDVKLSLNDFVVKAAALALARVPEVNVTWTDDAVMVYEQADISVAIALEGGLITPIVRHADRLSIDEISSEIRSLASRARAGGLRPAEYEGGGLTVSNLGMYGVESFSAIINPPQSCILAVGASMRRPVVRDDACVPATVIRCTLSVDHRSVDGVTGARYLAVVKEILERPHTWSSPGSAAAG
jgi:pyruvate dehydrogenase E2 component (dihydrolipoamide acetyltransferase)